VKKDENGGNDNGIAAGFGGGLHGRYLWWELSLAVILMAQSPAQLLPSSSKAFLLSAMQNSPFHLTFLSVC
jgi:hypothetical protein